MAKYYLLYNKNKITHFVPFFNESFPDITAIDALILSSTREELEKKVKESYPSIDLENKEIFIAKVVQSKSPEAFKVSFYEPIFNNQKPHYQRILLQFQKLAFQRYQKIEENETSSQKQSIKLSQNEEFHVLVQNLVNEIISNHQFQLYITQNTTQINPRLKQALIRISTYSDYNLWLKTIQNILTSYMSFRNLIYEYLKFYQEVPIIPYEDIKERKGYSFPSYIFNYAYDFQILLADANSGYFKNYIPKLQPAEEIASIEASILHEAKTTSFSDSMCAQLYQEGGIEAIMAMDGNDLYSLPASDLLKLGLISDEMYLERTKNSRKRSY